jgi:hypothetical protein
LITAEVLVQVVQDIFVGLNFYVFLNIHNDASRGVSIDRIDLLIVNKDDPKHFWIGPSQASVSRSSALAEFPTGEVVLKPGDHWAEVTRFYKLPSYPDEESANDLADSFRKELEGKLASPAAIPADALANQDALPSYGERPEVGDDLVVKARALYERQAFFRKGNYDVYLVCVSGEDTVLGIQKAELLVFENHVRSLNRVVDNFRYGVGVILNGPLEIPAPTQLRLRRAAYDPHSVQVYQQYSRGRL